MRARYLVLVVATVIGGALAVSGTFASGDGGSGAMMSPGGGQMMTGGRMGSPGHMMNGGTPGQMPGGMMGSPGWMMRGSVTPARCGAIMGRLGSAERSSASLADLEATRERVDRQLAAWGLEGFAVAEVMAFSTNDYVLVRDAAGVPAFELVADPSGRWLMPEPQSMMWNTGYGMARFARGAVSGMWSRMTRMAGCGSAVGSSEVALTVAQARERAEAWLAANRSAETVADLTALPGYVTVDVAKAGRTVGMLSVDRANGTVWWHTWHGAFLADHDY